MTVNCIVSNLHLIDFNIFFNKKEFEKIQF